MDDGHAFLGELDEMEVVQLVRQQHDEIRDLFARIEAGEFSVVSELLDRLALHLEIEEAVLYPALLATPLHALMRVSAEEHLSVKRIIADVVEASPSDERFLARLIVLRQQVEEHMDAEEIEVLPEIERLLDPDRRIALAQEMTAFMQTLVADGDDGPLEAVLSDAAAPAI